MVEKELIRLMLRYDFWDNNKQNILRDMFPENLKQIYNLIVKTHYKLKKDLSVQELKALYTVEYPVATKANKDALFMILDDLPTEISDEVGKEVLKKAWLIESARRLTEIGIDIVNGKTPEIEKARKIVEAMETGRVSDAEAIEALSDDLDDILEAIDLTQKWKYNISQLQAVVPGIGPGVFKAAFGRVESGKSAYWISLCAGPSGFAHQGARINAYCNEEAAQRSQGRAVMAATGMSLDTLIQNKEVAREQYSAIKDNLKFFEAKGFTIYQIENHIKQTKPDLIIFDQLDKVQIDGSFAREDERLGALYVYARDICTKYECGGIAISQANAESEGKAYLSTANMALARTSKAAELDILIGIGKSPLHDDKTRVLNVVKNKLSGSHKDVVCQLQSEISRYVD